MSYSIMRVEKIKGGVNTTGIQRHVQRENKNYNNKDIDHDKSDQNYDLLHGHEKQDFKNLIEKRIEDGYTGKKKIRSDAVRHVDGIMTSDNEFFDGLSQEQTKKYFQDSLEFLEKEYGKENMLYATVHMDESTPHMHYGVVPLTEDGRLSAKEVVGNKKALTDLQDRYNQFMNDRGYNLERGQSKQVTEQKHVDMDQYKQGTEYHKQEYQKAHDKAEKEAERLEFLTNALEPQELTYKGYEMQTEIKDKLFGKSEVTEKETGNVVLTPEQYKKAAEQINAASAIQKDYERLKGTDLAQENEELHKKSKHNLKLAEEILTERLQAQNENHDLKQENKKLKTKNQELRQELAKTRPKTKDKGMSM